MHTLVLLAALTSGCALTSKARPREIRYFTPELAGIAGAVPTSRLVAGPKLRLGRVTSSEHLDTPIVFRRSQYELGAYESLRWTERPEQYVRRTVHDALFGTSRLTEVAGGPSPTLDLELVLFEETRHGHERGARLKLRWVLRADREVLGSGAVDIEERAASATIEGVVAAAAAALSSACNAVAAWAEKRLATIDDP